MKPSSHVLMFDRAGLRDLDRRAVGEYEIPISTLMENAGRAVAEAVLRILKKNAKVAVVCGTGNNGGDGLVAARHLHNAGVRVLLLLMADVGAFRDMARQQLTIVERMRMPLEIVTPGHPELRDWIVEGSPDDLIVDAIFGTGLSRPVEGMPREVVHAINDSRRTVISIDIPSGLDCDSGQPLGEAIKAIETVSMCGAKIGFNRPGAKAYTGKVTIGDIGAPVELLRELAIR